jgi:methylenetetrahydrofolate reductase (NADPH)
MIRKIHVAGDVKGFHFCTLNLEKSVQRVLEGLQWAGATGLEVHNKLIAVCLSLMTPDDAGPLTCEGYSSTSGGEPEH